MGDSISTFEGYNPKGYEVYYDRQCQIVNEMRNVEDTWWMQVLHAMDAILCVNNAYSGSMVSGKTFPSAISEERLEGLHPTREGHKTIADEWIRCLKSEVFLKV